MEGLREQALQEAKKSRMSEQEAWHVTVDQQKHTLQESINYLRSRSESLTHTHQELMRAAQEVLQTEAPAWQARHEHTVENAMDHYQEQLAEFSRRQEEPDFMERVTEYDALRKTYENELAQHQARVNEVSHEVSRLRYQRNRMERDVDQTDQTELENVNQRLKEAQEKKDAILKEKKENSQIKQMKEELEQKAVYDEDRYIAKNAKGEVIEPEVLKEKLNKAQSNINMQLKQVDKGLMHLINTVHNEQQNIETVIHQAALTFVAHNHLNAQIVFLNGLKPSEIKKEQDRGAAALKVQTEALNEKRPKDEEAMEKYLGLRVKAYKEEQKLDKVNHELKQEEAKLGMLNDPSPQTPRFTNN